MLNHQFKAMKKTLLLAVFILLTSTYGLSAQSVPLQEGQIMRIILPEDGTFNHLKFPRKNFIIKRGGIADMKSVDANLVVITDIRDTSSGTQIVLKRQDGRKFFRAFPSVTATWPAALETGELEPVE